MALASDGALAERIALPARSCTPVPDSVDLSASNNKNIKAVRMDGVFPKMHTNLILYRKRTPSLQCVNFVKLMWPRWKEGSRLAKA